MTKAATAGAITLAMTLGPAPARADARGEPARVSVHRGVEVPIAAAPWMATLTPLDARLRPAVTEPGHALRCSAAVIGPKLVLTATHCVVDVDMGHQGIRVGTDDLLRNPGRVIPVARVWSPRVRARTLTRPNATDTAIVETTEPLGVPALALATERPSAGDTVTALGFGDDRAVTDDRGVVRPRLRRWDATVMEHCPLGLADPAQICATAPDGGGTRPGDSGGPLVVWRDGVPALVGNTVQDASIGTVSVSAFADVAAQRAFVTAPPPSTLASVLSRPIRIRGSASPGRRVTCDAAFAPEPIRVAYDWYIGGRARRGSVYYDRRGRRAAYRDDLGVFSQRRSIRIPRGAAGKRLQCTITAHEGPFFRLVAVAVVPRIGRRPPAL